MWVHFIKIDIIQLMIKKESVQISRKTIECNFHGNPIKFKCQNSNCSRPYLCSDIQCIEEHFHEEGKAVMTRFNTFEWESKLVEVQNVINDDRLEVRERHLAKLVDYFQSHLKTIQQNLKQFDLIKNKFSQSSSLNVDSLGEVNGVLSLGSKIDREIDKMRAKIIDQDMSFSQSSQVEPIEQNEEIQNQNEEEANAEHQQPQEEQAQEVFEPQSPAKSVQNAADKTLSTPKKSDKNGYISNPFQKQNQIEENPYYEDENLTIFLQKNINDFSWDKAEVIFTYNTPFTTCEKFHQKLRDRERLLFIFLGEGQIIGSFYPEAYPTITEKDKRHKRDENSFIFIQDNELEGNFAHFVADPDSQFHISVSEKLLICHGNTPNNGDGLRTFQRNFQNLVYFMPSRSFKDSIEKREVTYNGMLKVRQFFVLQIN